MAKSKLGTTSLLGLVIAICMPVYGFAAAPERNFFLGDSLTDNGNFGVVFGPVAGPGTAPPGVGLEDPAAYPSPTQPASYGKGVFSNGTTWSGQYAPNHVNANEYTGDSTYGVNFAWGGAVANIAHGLAPVPTLNEQLLQFESGAFGAINPTDAVFLWFGGNDLQNMMSRQDEDALADPSSDASMTVLDAMGVAAATVADGVDRLVAAGAKIIVVNNLPDVGQTPRYIGEGGGTQRAMSAGSSHFNTALEDEIGLVRETLPDDVVLIEADLAAQFSFLLSNLHLFGFTVADQTCLETEACRNGSDAGQREYVFWDGIHPTTRTHELIAITLHELFIPEQRVAALAGQRRQLPALTGRPISRLLLGQQGTRGIGDVYQGRFSFQNAATTQQADYAAQDIMVMAQRLGEVHSRRESRSGFFVTGGVEFDEVNDTSSAYTSEIGGGTVAVPDVSTRLITVLAGLSFEELGRSGEGVYGVATGYSHLRSQSGEDAAELSANLFHLAAFGEFTGKASNRAFTFSLGAGGHLGRADIKRRTGLPVQLRGDTNMYGLWGAMGARALFGGTRFAAGPVAGLHFAHQTMGAYDESGAPGAAFRVAEQDSQALIAEMGLESRFSLTIPRDERAPTKGHFSIGWEQNLLDDDLVLSADNIGTRGAPGAAVSISADTDSRLTVGFGLKAPLGRRASFAMVYDGATAFSGNSNRHAVHTDFVFRF